MNYTIKKGEHRSTNSPIFMTNKNKEKYYGVYKVTISFHEYVSEENDFYSKLIGSGFIMPEYRSERIGWRHKGSNLIGLVCFSDNKYKHSWGNEILAPIEYSPLTGRYTCSFFVEFFPTFMSVFTSASNITYTQFDKMKCFPLVLNNPYFGGNPFADQDYMFDFNKVSNSTKISMASLVSSKKIKFNNDSN